jgi:hypothetical protein
MLADVPRYERQTGKGEGYMRWYTELPVALLEIC